MKKAIILPVVIALAVVLLGGCSGSKQATIELEGNPTTGYTWTYTMTPGGIVKEVSSTYEEDNSAGEDMAGVGGKFIFVFEGENAGNTTLNFEYKREWEEEAPIETATYELSVDNGGNVEIIGYP